ncbi:MAG: hypothetical protein IJN91_05265 [Alphaproteobacteria bacterium]|nr:hypothetical protein [Alphaproteobacteria bacterium]
MIRIITVLLRKVHKTLNSQKRAAKIKYKKVIETLVISMTFKFMAHPEGLFNSHTINRVGPFSPRKIQTALRLFSSTIGSNPRVQILGCATQIKTPPKMVVFEFVAHPEGFEPSVF